MCCCCVQQERKLNKLFPMMLLMFCSLCDLDVVALACLFFALLRMTDCQHAVVAAAAFCTYELCTYYTLVQSGANNKCAVRMLILLCNNNNASDFRVDIENIVIDRYVAVYIEQYTMIYV